MNAMPPALAAGNGAMPNSAQPSAPNPQPARTPQDGSCVSTGTIEASLRPSNLLFLIDRSASMRCNPPPTTDSATCESTPARAQIDQPSKWELVRDALEHVIEQLPPSASAGITYFSNDDDCGVQSLPHVSLQPLDAEHIAALDASLDAVEPQGGTPIVGGLILAYKQLNPDQTAGLPYGDRFVVLITDGQEGCAPEETARLLDSELPKSRQARITTFVIGVPGSEVNRRFLSQLAFAGGAPARPDCDHESSDPAVGDCQFDMSRDPDLGAALSTALGAISGRALSCEFDVPQPKNGGELDYERVNVVYTERVDGAERVVAMDATRACDGGADGWQYNGDRSRIVLCGGACERVRSAASIRIALGCKSVEVM
jgi:hypothetical protein